MKVGTKHLRLLCSRLGSYARDGVLLVLAELLILQPLLPLLEPYIAQAAETPSAVLSASDQACFNYAESIYNPGARLEGEQLPDATYLEGAPDWDIGEVPPLSETGEEVQASSETEEEASEEEIEEMEPIASLEGTVTPAPGTRFLQKINLTALKESPSVPTAVKERLTSTDYVTALLRFYGIGHTYYQMPANATVEEPSSEWVFVCDNAVQEMDSAAFSPFGIFDNFAYQYFSAVIEPNPRIVFASKADEFAVFGERCTGTLRPHDQWDEGGSNPCEGFSPEDDFFTNGEWDAPKVDERVIYTLLYLVTPYEQGGAGRERIRVKRVTKNERETDFPPEPTPGPSLEVDVADLPSGPDDLLTLNEETGEAEEILNDSSYWVDPAQSAFLPEVVSTSLQIDEIDSVRVSTKIEKKRLFGNNSVSYQFQAPFPVKVAWQSDDGLNKNPPPDFTNLSMYEGSSFLATSAVIELLNQYGFGDLELDVADTDIASFGDVALLVGQSLLEQLLGTPRNSLKGYDLASTLQNIGLAYLEQNLGLVPGSLTDRNSLDQTYDGAQFDSVVQNIGRATVEYVLEFPRGSLRTKNGTSTEVLESVGRRYLEKEVFKVSEGTLTPGEGYPITTIGDLLARLGEGRMEYVFKLPAQSLRKKSFDDPNPDLSFRHSSYKATLLFPKEGDQNAPLNEDHYLMADYVSTQLNLALDPLPGTQLNSYGFGRDDFDVPSLKIAPRNLEHFKQIVGSRVIETTVGVFRKEGSSQRMLGEAVPTPQGPITINNHPLDPTFRPMYSNPPYGQVSNYGWCDAVNGQSPKYVTPNKDELTFDGSNYDEFISKLKQYGGKNDWTDHAMDCTTTNVSAQSRDLPLLSELNDLLLATNEVQRLEFINQDGEPKKHEFTSFNPEDGAYGAHAEWRYNTALIAYYNNPKNQQEKSVNTIRPRIASTAGVPDPNGKGPVPTPTPVTVGQVLQELRSGSSQGEFRFEADSSLQARFRIIEDLLRNQQQSNPFNLESLTGLTDDALDSALVDRYNLIAVQPNRFPDSFLQQYNDPQYNGWLFIIKDLIERLRCKQTNGYYRLADSKVAFTCDSRQNVDEIDQDATHRLNETISALTRLSWNIRSMAGTIIDSLNSGAVVDGSGTSNQSAQSVALGLAGQSHKMDSNGRLLKRTEAVPEYEQDLMRILVSPRLTAQGVVPLDAPVTPFFSTKPDGDTPLNEIGRSYAARKFSDDPLAQRSFINQLKTNFSKDIETFKRNAGAITSIFDTAEAQALEFGIDSLSLEEKGLENGDFQRIFQLDAADSVFERVGKDELLRTVWRRSGVATRVRSTKQYQGLLKRLRDITQEVSFYTSRVERINQLSNQLEGQLNGLSGLSSDIARARENVHAVRSGTTERTSNIQQLKLIARAYEPAVTKVRRFASERNQHEIRQTAAEILHLAEEIAAGRPLPRSGSGNGLGSGPSRGGSVDDACFTKEELINLFSGTDTETALTNLGLKLGGCRIDSGLNLPEGSMFTWYSLGKQDWPPDPTNYAPDLVLEYDDISLEDAIGKAAELESNLYNTSGPVGQETTAVKEGIPAWKKNQWGIGNLKLAVGIADTNKNSVRLDVSENLNALNELRSDEVLALKKRGEQILRATALSKLASLVPGVGKLMGKYRLTEKDLVAIFQGNLNPLMAKVGGSALDRAMNLPSGTGAELIFPTCHDNSGTITACRRNPDEPGTDPDNSRMQTLSAVGLRKLGLTVPDFPRYFSFTSGGNLLENWGNASISQALHLSPNSFTGSIVPSADARCTSIRCLNTVYSTADAFSLTASPFTQQLNKLRTSLTRAFNQLPSTTAALTDPLSRSEFIRTLESTIDRHLETLTLARLYSKEWQGRGYWGDEGSANAQVLYEADMASYRTAMTDLWNLFGGAETTLGSERVTVFDFETSTLMRQALLKGQASLFSRRSNLDVESLSNRDSFPSESILNPAEESDRTQIANISDRYSAYIRYFHERIDELNTRFVGNLSWNSNDPTSFQAFLQNRTAAESLSKSQGIQATAGIILSEKFDSWIAEQAPEWLKELNDAFRLITADPAICGKEVGFGNFLAGIVTNVPGSCSLEGLSKGTDLNQILYSNEGNYVRLRTLLFDRYLSKAFTDLEDGVGFRLGTFRAMAADPKRTRQILINEGVIMVADKVFGSAEKNSLCQIRPKQGELCLRQGVMSAARSAFIAGFYDPETKQYSLDFQQDRSIEAFNTLILREVDARLGRFGMAYLGAEITRADLSLLVRGDTKVLAYIGVQFLANQANRSLLGGDLARHPNAKYFYLNFNDVRDASGLPNAVSFREAELRAREDYLLTDVCPVASCEGRSPEELRALQYEGIRLDREREIENLVSDPTAEENVTLVSWKYKELDSDGNGLISENESKAVVGKGFNELPESSRTAIQRQADEELYNAGIAGRDYEMNAIRAEAKDRVTYGLLDAAAFRLNQNIPPNFSKRMMSGDATLRAEAIGELGFNVLLGNSNILQDVCNGQSSTECYTLFREFAEAVTVGQGSGTALQLFFFSNEKFLNALDGGLASYFSREFDTNLPPGLFKGIYVWGMHGFKRSDFAKEDICPGDRECVPAGRILQDWGISEAAQWTDKQLGLSKGTTAKVIKLHGLVQDLQKLRKSGAFVDDVAKKKAVTSAKLEIAALGSDIIVGLARESLLNLDQALGLPRGTMQLIVGAGLTYGIAIATGVASSAATAAAFGPAFFIYLGVQLVFGVVDVVVTNRGSGDGYYPFYVYETGEARNWKMPFSEHHTTDTLTPEFDPTIPASYYAGLKRVAQTKVQGLLLNIFMMPNSSWALRFGLKPADLWVSQVFTHNAAEFNPFLDPTIANTVSQPAPWGELNEQQASIAEPALGYDPLTERCEEIVVDDIVEGAATCTRQEGLYAGPYPISLPNAIHIRF